MAFLLMGGLVHGLPVSAASIILPFASELLV